MKFGPVALEDAEGSVLAHSVQGASKRLKKGTQLSPSDIADLHAAGIREVITAQLDMHDLSEDDAAAALADQLINENISASAPFTGRSNLFAETAGVLQIDTSAVNALNRIDEAITLATLPNRTRVAPGTLIGTVKIIPYGVAKSSMAQVSLNNTISIAPFKLKTASLILTQTPAISDKALNKGKSVIAKRASDLGLTLIDQAIVPHDSVALADCLNTSAGDIILILGASATSDRADVAPSGLIEAGGTLTRFGMPVDPGNLLFLGDLGGRPVVGLPGCARSPVLNGADWVLERLVAGLDVTTQSIAEMGVGGLLKENPKRPQPRAAKALPSRANVDVILLAAGGSTRMRGGDKLLEDVSGEPILRHLAQEMVASKARALRVVLRPQDTARDKALEGLAYDRVTSANWEDGMSASIRSGLAALPPDCDGAIIALADMPDISRAHINKLIAAFSPDDDREIVRATSKMGKSGHPVLFGRRFFESLTNLSGDRGARELLQDMREFVVELPFEGDAAVTDLDTPEDWANWRRSKSD